jgi:hypothetical protein
MIVVVEPFCQNFEHTHFNASFLQTVSIAFPEEEIRFYAESEHLSLVEKLVTANGNIKNISFSKIRIPDKKTTSNIRRIPGDFLLCLKTLFYSLTKKANIVIFSTASTQTLYSLKLMLPMFKKVMCYSITHAIIQSIQKKPENFQDRLFWFRRALSFYSPENFRILTIGEITKNWLCREMPGLEKNIASVEMAYIFDDINIISKEKKSGSIKFGFLGVANIRKGADLFFKLAEEVNKRKFEKNVEFTLIGKIEDEELKKLTIPDNLKIPSPDCALSKEDFSKYIQEIDYAVILYDRKFYDILHGASMMDCLEHIKPIIALRTTFLEYFFHNLGNIGVLCNSFEEIRGKVFEIIEDETYENYLQRKMNILNGRKMCSPEYLAKSYRDALIKFSK